MTTCFLDSMSQDFVPTGPNTRKNELKELMKNSDIKHLRTWTIWIQKAAHRKLLVSLSKYQVYDKNCVQLLKKLLSKLQGLCTITLAVTQVNIIIIMVILEITYLTTNNYYKLSYYKLSYRI